MKILLIHSDFVEFEAKNKAIKTAPELKVKGKQRVDDCLVVFSAVEKSDEGREKVIAENASREVISVAKQVGAKRVVLYPFVHLTSAPSKPDTAIAVLDQMEGLLKNDYELFRAPFGYYKSFDVKCKGHPLSELSRSITAEGGVSEEILDLPALRSRVSKTVLDREKLKENDHRILGQTLDLFSFYNVAPGMVFWHPKGMVIRNKLIEYWREEHRKAGYTEVMTPQVMEEILWKISGHWDHYKENIFLSEYDKRRFAVKPMNCPGGILIYKSRARSYRELPMRASELGLVHRVELSGVLSGMFRVTQFTQDDAHIYCTEEQLEDEIGRVIDLVGKMYGDFHLPFTMELSTKPEKAMGDPKLWEKAESTLEKVLKKRKAAYKINKGDGAFYGPKIDFHIQDSLGRKWQLATLQLDFQMPERFDMAYTGEDGRDHRPIMLHRTVFGSLERFVGIITEHYNGNFPLWLAPVQVRVLSFSEKNNKAAERVYQQLFDLGYRVEKDVSSGTVQAKVRDAELQKIPYILVIGDKEEDAGTLAVREHGAKKPRFGVKFDEFAKEMDEKIKAMK